MLFSAPLSGLIIWCRSFKHGLAAGLSLPRVFRLQAQKGPLPMRSMADRIADQLEKGDSLEDALTREGTRLPTLFIELASVGERTGHLSEMFGELADYYELQRTLRRQFWSEAMWPIFQFFAAVFVIFVLILIMGMLKEGSAPIGFGLSGFKGGMILLLAVATFLGSILAIYLLLTRGLRQRAVFEAFLLRIPGIGPAVRSFAMGRFCLALRSTLETGMSPHEALRQSLRATGNAAFSVHEDRVAAIIKSGQEINVAMRVCTAFPEEFIEIVAVAEIGGQIPEVMIRQAEAYREDAVMRMKTVTRMGSFGVWAVVALMLIWAIFRIASTYLGALNAAGG